MNGCLNVFLHEKIREQVTEVIGSEEDICSKTKQKKTILKLSYNLGHNILRLFDALPNFPFTTSETNRDY